ncbi:alpha/beta hydrolase [Lactiplantibacillus sp. DA1]|uniref:alpha/beta hydrolase n=1 Tax=Lactiplantibacillus sp. DA1 TaxID=3079857 RepID=UPI00292A6769|nr:alpha/beta hydrolase [Lactiplantibacillus sp. DA1]MDV0430704.1 alpha/beta hydrolase [Lactiplantibacillus sp. DA1]
MLSKEAHAAIAIAQTIKLQQAAPLTAENIKQARIGADNGNSYTLPDSVTLKIVKTDKVNGEFYLLNQNQHPETVLMFLHGGAYATGTVKSRRELAINLGLKSGYDTFSVDYRQYPEAKHPAAQHDVERAYQYLQERYQNVVLFGESAGASLALTLTLALRDQQKKLPARIVVFSPVITQLNLLASEFLNQERDPMLLGAGKPVPYFDHPESTSPLVSPIYGDYMNFPPIMINCGTEEVKYDDAVILNKLCEDAHVPVTFKAWRDLFHVFVLFDMPETEVALTQIASFLQL